MAGGPGGAAPSPFGTSLPQILVPPPGPRSRAASQRLGRVESRNVTFTSDAWPVFWDEALGSNVRDVDGNVFLDLTSGFGVALIGHRSAALRRALDVQADRLIHGMGDIHPPAVKVELLERLAAIAPWPDTRTILATSGSEAVEAALKTARLASGRPGILAFEGGYHGLTLGSLAATARPAFRAPFSERVYGGVAFAPFPDPVRDGAEASARSLAGVERLLDGGTPTGAPIGTIIVEPVQARGGARVPPPGFMTGLGRLARDRDLIVVADEIMTGLGRCGALFASERVGLEPDVVCIGKALGGGIPISACLAPARIMDAWPPSGGEAIHTSTFLGHPLACAAALAVLTHIEESGVPARADRVGGSLRQGLGEALTAADGVADVRGLGLLLGLELVEEDGVTPATGRAALVSERALREGLLLLPAGDEGHVVELTPPVTLTKEQIEHVVDVLPRLVREAS